MADRRKASVHERWAHLRFSVVGPLLAAPPEPGELQAALQQLAEKKWRHPVTEDPVQFSFSTIERWLYRSMNAGADPVGVLRKRVRKDSGQQSAINDKVKAALLAQYGAHKSWSYQLHHDTAGAIESCSANISGRLAEPFGLHRRHTRPRVGRSLMNDAKICLGHSARPARHQLPSVCR